VGAEHSDKNASKPSWHGRFEKAPARITQTFVESLSIDWRLWKHDIAGSLAHAEMLCEAGLINKKDLEAIRAGLQKISQQIERGEFQFVPADEDIHMAIERALIEQVGEAGKKLHTARSRNDQVALDLRLYLRDAINGETLPALRSLQAALVELAERQGLALMPGYTHLQRAQPVLLGAYLLSLVEALERDTARLHDALKRINICPLGSGALAGTTLPINRRSVAEKLGFAGITENSIDSTSDRDPAVEYVFCCAMIAAHLSRLAEDWILFCSQEFAFLQIDEAYCTGSSMMPQKRNPDLLELIRGRTARAYAALTGLLTVLKGLPSGYNRDLQEDKYHLFAAHDCTVACLKVAAEVVSHSRFNEQAMKAALQGGFIDATALAEYLVLKGVPFRQAHEIVGRLVRRCEQEGVNLSDLTLEAFRQVCDKIDADVYGWLGPENVVRRYTSAGSAGVREFRRSLAKWKRRLARK